MKTDMKNAVIYIPSGPNVSPSWEAVRGALEAAGVKDIRPAPMPVQSFAPALPVMFRSGEV